MFGVSAEGALAISRAFRSPRDYANALGRCGTAEEKLDLVQVKTKGGVWRRAAINAIIAGRVLLMIGTGRVTDAFCDGGAGTRQLPAETDPTDGVSDAHPLPPMGFHGGNTYILSMFCGII